MTEQYKEKDLGTQGQEDTLKGKAKETVGKVQSKVGQVTGNADTEAKGDAKQVEGKAQSALGKGERKVDQALDPKNPKSPNYDPNA
ncbi:MAG TPA: CsbD family protein [Ktedonobacteraceae bacterium]|nr:CsbD family protein [Ktedonobacteraceae bacterium]